MPPTPSHPGAWTVGSKLHLWHGKDTRPFRVFFPAEASAGWTSSLRQGSGRVFWWTQTSELAMVIQCFSWPPVGLAPHLEGAFFLGFQVTRTTTILRGAFQTHTHIQVFSNSCWQSFEMLNPRGQFLTNSRKVLRC